ncbi:hypothetical protein ACSBR1_011061 [Camellia fascicularis]
MMFLPLLRDFDRIHEFNWGAATLACLHRMLCRATKPNTKEMAGPLVLLQFIWEPFRTENEIMTGFPSYCTIGGDIWMARVPLICFDITEWHLPGRVLRKFGWVQGVPDRFDVHLAMVFRDRRGKMAIDWAKEYETFTDDWNNRRNNIIHTKRSNEVLTSSDPYILWFHRQTRLVLSNPSDIAAFGYQGIGGSLKSLVHRVARAYHLADSAHITHDGSDALDAIVEI